MAHLKKSVSIEETVDAFLLERVKVAREFKNYSDALGYFVRKGIEAHGREVMAQDEEGGKHGV